jgi:predicted lipid-binding transport protein (Tim44 family)
MVRLVSFFIALMLLVPFLEDAEAKRFGGGRSFGSKPTYSQPAKQQSTARQETGTQQTTQAAPGATAPRPGGMMGGMLGGLLMGGLIGSLLMGGGFGAGIGLIEILLIGGGLYLLFRVLKSRRSAMEPALQGAGAGAGASASGWGGEWDRLRSGGGSAGQAQAQTINVPPGFDQEDFLEGAKAMYTRMQESWSTRDMEDIASFVTPGMMEEVRRQDGEDPTRQRVEVMLVNARLLEVRSEGSQSVASVFFDVLLREDPNESRPTQAREVWHFVRDDSVKGDSWRLEGIQQLEQ